MALARKLPPTISWGMFDADYNQKYRALTSAIHQKTGRPERFGLSPWGETRILYTMGNKGKIKCTPFAPDERAEYGLEEQDLDRAFDTSNYGVEHSANLRRLKKQARRFRSGPWAGCPPSPRLRCRCHCNDRSSGKSGLSFPESGDLSPGRLRIALSGYLPLPTSTPRWQIISTIMQVMRTTTGESIS